MPGEEAAEVRQGFLVRWSARAASFPRGILGLPRDLRLLYVSNVVFAFGIGLYANAWPLYIKNGPPAGLGAGPAVGLVLSLGAFLTTAIFPLGGILADRWDRRKVIILGTVLQTLSPLAYFAARTWWELIPGILLFYGGIVAGPAFIAYLSDCIPREREMEGFGLFYTSFPLGLVVSPLVGAVLVSFITFRYLFPLVFVLFVAALLLVLPIRPMPPRPRGPSPGPALPRATRPRIILLALSAAPFLLAGPYYPVILQDRGFTEAQVLAVGSLTAVGMVVLSWTLGRQADVRSRRMALALCNVVFILVAMTTLSPLPLLLIPAAFLLGASNASRSLADPIVSRLTEEGKGWTLSLYLSLENFAAAIAILAGGYLYEANPVLPFALSIPFLALIAGIFWAFPSFLEVPGPPLPGPVAIPAVQVSFDGRPPGAR